MDDFGGYDDDRYCLQHYPETYSWHVTADAWDPDRDRGDATAGPGQHDDAAVLHDHRRADGGGGDERTDDDKRHVTAIARAAGTRNGAGFPGRSVASSTHRPYMTILRGEEGTNSF